MNRRWSEADVRAVTHRLRNAIQDPFAPTSGRLVRSKYRNVKITYDGRVFDSKSEMRAYQDFKAQELAGAIRAVIPQVSLPLPGTTRRARIDFLVIELDGAHRWYDRKGWETQTSKLKRQMLLDGYGIRVELI